MDSPLFRRTAATTLVRSPPRSAASFGSRTASRSSSLPGLGAVTCSTPLAGSWGTVRSAVGGDQRRVEAAAAGLCSREEEERRTSAEALGKLASAPRTAAMVTEYMGTLGRRLKDPERNVRSAVLRVFRNLAENGEVKAVGQYSREIVALLMDDDMAIQSKTAALCRVIAEEGGAGCLVKHVPQLIECFESSSCLVTPLHALRAMADAGEAEAVARGVSRLVAALSDESCRVRCAACEALTSLGQSGGGELLRRLRLVEPPDNMLRSQQVQSASSPTNREESGAATIDKRKPQLLQALTELACHDDDPDTQLAAARALKSIAEADEATAQILREQHALPLVHAVCRHRWGPRAELRRLLQSMLRPPEAGGVELMRNRHRGA